MQIFKFGGASVKDASGVKNIVAVLQTMEASNKVVVISAMGKTTNAMEAVVKAYFKETSSAIIQLQESIDYHASIVKELFKEGHQVHTSIQLLFDELKGFLFWNKSPKYDFVYDQIVSYGELISTTIVSFYLKEQGIKNTWLDARNLIKTNSNYRDASVDWDQTQRNIKENIVSKGLYITQGFIASDSNNFTTTLGREGSDYTGGIFAYCLGAQSLTIWKDVPGVLNGDPRVFENTALLHEIPYEEAIELAFYGASVIHPKTLQPLQRKEITLFVKSFKNPTASGTSVTNTKSLVPLIPCYIVKKGQVLISLSSLDFSFMMEDHIGEVFKLLAQYKMKVDLIQNSAISFSVCVDNKFNRLEELTQQLKGKFKIDVQKDVSLYTVRHATTKKLEEFTKGKNILLKQVAGRTVQLIVQE
ncbi:aspartate kinase [Dokdonia sp. Hel_I_53]|uniref:aspartate kinase n=1 Tax=Dokdonia sp. Hel_I_53 TaxID=1566287 RepID=UPI001199E1ED|nr:aspartate kinase [Dokdonia sp. Hel_I_53]TVZ52481.1 aspartate kinase [Dokdonia sp. Hel_I_53]